MKIIHIAPLTLKKSAGLTYSIPSFVDAQNALDGVEAEILVSINVNTRKSKFIYLDQFESKNEVRNYLSTFDIAVFHSTYIYSHIKLASMLKKLQIPYIIVPRGGFSKKSKSTKWLKKAIGDILVFKKFFKSPFAIHYLTKNERDNSLYRTSNDFILPNGIQLPLIVHEKSSVRVNKKFIITYIGRIDIYIKGIDIMLEALKICKNELLSEGVIVELFGPCEKNTALKIDYMINQFDIMDIVKLYPPLYGNDKEKKLSNTDIFIQTSRFEGLPMGVLEALAYGVPCVLTPGTNLSREVHGKNAGVEVELEPESISRGILSIIKNTEELTEMGENARKLAKEYSWRKIAYDSLINYRKICNTNQINTEV